MVKQILYGELENALVSYSALGKFDPFDIQCCKMSALQIDVKGTEIDNCSKLDRVLFL